MFVQGKRVRFSDGERGTVGKIESPDQIMIPVLFEDLGDHGETKMVDIAELRILERDSGHCHGCNKFQTLIMVDVQIPLRATGAMFRWDCKHCGYRNAEFNPMRVDLPNNRQSLECLTCHEKITPFKTGN
jgi:hypothetical protein